MCRCLGSWHQDPVCVFRRRVSLYEWNLYGITSCGWYVFWFPVSESNPSKVSLHSCSPIILTDSNLSSKDSNLSSNHRQRTAFMVPAVVLTVWSITTCSHRLKPTNRNSSQWPARRIIAITIVISANSLFLFSLLYLSIYQSNIFSFEYELILIEIRHIHKVGDTSNGARYAIITYDTPSFACRIVVLW